MTHELTPEVRTELVNELLLYRGIQRKHLFEYPNRADDSRRYIEESEVLLNKIISASDQARGYSAPELTVWDIGSPQPESVVRVVEVDETGEIRPSNSLHQYSNVWRKAADTGRWMSHKGVPEVRDWDDLVRRYGPVADFDQGIKRS